MNAAKRGRFSSALAILGALLGAGYGTAALCQAVPQEFALAWLVSIVSLVHVFAARRGNGPHVGTVWKFAAASVFVLCFVMLVAIAASQVANPAAIGPAEIAVIAVLGTVGTTSAWLALHLGRR